MVHNINRFQLNNTFVLSKIKIRMRIGSENRKKRISILIITVSIIMTLFFLPKHVLRYFYWNYADLNDYKKFPSVEMKKGGYTFFFNESKFKFQIPEKFNPENKWQNFDEFLEKNINDPDFSLHITIFDKKLL